MFDAAMIRRTAVGALAALCMLAWSGRAAPPAQAADPLYTFRLATAGNVGQPLYETAKAWADEINTKSNGRIHVDVFPNSQLGDEPASVQGVLTGTIDMGAITIPPWTTVEPRLGVFALPYIFRSIQQAEAKAKSPTALGILNSLEAKGAKAFALGDDGWLVISSKKALRAPADFSNVRIRVLPGPIDAATMKAFGAQPQQVAYAEMYLALKQGVIDAAEASLTGQYTSKMYEVTKFLALTNHLWLPDILVMNSAKFAALPPDLKTIVTNAAQVAVAVSFADEAKLTEDYSKRLAANGMEVIRYTDIAPFQAAARPVWDQFSDRIGKPLIDEMAK